MNERVRAREVRVIDEDGQVVGVMSSGQALALARERNVDLVEVSPMASPPVCRLMDYGRFKYEQAKKENEARKRQKTSELKEIRLSPKTDEHDIAVKVRKVEEFLGDGDKVKVVVRFRGREMAHPELGRRSWLSCRVPATCSLLFRGGVAVHRLLWRSRWSDRIVGAGRVCRRHFVLWLQVGVLLRPGAVVRLALTGGGGRLLLRLPVWRLRQDHGHHATFHDRRTLDHGDVLHRCHHLFEQTATQIRVRHLASTETHNDLYLVAFAEELLDLAHLHGDIVLIRFWTQSDFFELRGLLALARLVLPLGLLVLEPSIVHQTADRRVRHRRYLDQVHISLTRHCQRLPRRHHPDDLSVLVNHADFTRTHALIHA